MDDVTLQGRLVPSGTLCRSETLGHVNAPWSYFHHQIPAVQTDHETALLRLPFSEVVPDIESESLRLRLVLSRWPLNEFSSESVFVSSGLWLRCCFKRCADDGWLAS